MHGQRLPKPRTSPETAHEVPTGSLSMADIRARNTKPAAIALRARTDVIINPWTDRTRVVTEDKIYLGVCFRNDQSLQSGFMITNDQGDLDWIPTRHFNPVNPARAYLFPHLQPANPQTEGA